MENTITGLSKDDLGLTMWTILFRVLFSGIYPSSFANVRFWTKIEFMNAGEDLQVL